MATSYNNPPLLGYKVVSTNKETSVWWIQQKLNRIYPDQHIAEDNQLGNETLRLIRRFQKDQGLSPDGIVGPLTYNALMKSDPLMGAKVAICKKESKKTPVDSIIQAWNAVHTSHENFITYVDKGLEIVKRFKIKYIHINWETIIADLLSNSNLKFKSTTGKGLIHFNSNPVYHHGWKAYSFSKIGKYIEGHKFRVGCLNLGFDLIDAGNKIWKGQLQIVDVGNYVKDRMETLAAYLASQGVAIESAMYRKPLPSVYNELMSKSGKVFAKKAWMPVLARGAAAATGAVCVVGVEVIGAIQLGVLIGQAIEKETHIGETAVNFYWDLFLGAWIEKFFEWKASRVVMLSYPPEWTEEDIKRFHKSVNHYS